MTSQKTLQLLYGEEEVSKLNRSNVLIVGAGGIGCELVKNLTKSGFKKFSIIDLDVIEFSNLNRQFYFRKEHVKKSKAEITKQKVLEICPDAQIDAFCANLFDEKFNNQFYQKFDLVFCALDNQEARRYLGRKCLENNLLMVDAGTSGFTGNVNTAIRQVNECNNCKPAIRSRTFNICSIRSKPSETIHCVVWSKNLYNLIFGPQENSIEIDDEDEDKELEESQNQLEQGTIDGVFDKPLNQYQDKELEQLGKKLFDKIFFTNISEQDVSKYHEENGKKQLSLQIDGIKITDKKVTSHLKPVNFEMSQQLNNIPSEMQNNVGKAEDQIIKTLSQYASDFVRNFIEIVQNQRNELGLLKYDKDDKRALQFVSAATNFRVYNFRNDADPQKLEYISARKIKEMNIIHAIGSTNAIVAAIQTTEAIKILRKQTNKLNYFKIANVLSEKIVPIPVEKQQQAKLTCEACGFNNIYVTLQANFNVHTLSQVFQILKKEFFLPDDFQIDIKNQDGSISTYQKPQGEKLNLIEKKQLQLYLNMLDEPIKNKFKIQKENDNIAKMNVKICDSEYQWVLELMHQDNLQKIHVLSNSSIVQNNIKQYKLKLNQNKNNTYMNLGLKYGF
ncbi:Molybdenum cofactor biosynthesis, MoeB [Pseudocohnilembus persalinus]|uniref:SUMO-activating enzyme subunit n=1 Tax=Pseudocohnilembus persalinus TaxID=266149 RepID=A0A0V0Q9N2_PSEPJ|nr:Molybdenum cofactor biosynthesis, MoeB [Pseudocohnilembus persalinus]|eukprot:KRW98931.1 Molybdenum cofactor biosynthesis, MoeB [Pseudocohnilembus persalinus]